MAPFIRLTFVGKSNLQVPFLIGRLRFGRRRLSKPTTRKAAWEIGKRRLGSHARKHHGLRFRLQGAIMHIAHDTRLKTQVEHPIIRLHINIHRYIALGY